MIGWLVAFIVSKTDSYFGCGQSENKGISWGVISPEEESLSSKLEKPSTHWCPGSALDWNCFVVLI